MSEFQPAPFGKYTLIERIGVGSLAECFRASAPDGEGHWTPVFLKRLIPHLSSDKKLVAAFSDAARLSRHFEHKNIARVLDFGIEEDTFYSAVEYLEAQSLQDLLAASRSRKHPMGVGKALYITAEICRGLAYAHAFEDPDGVVSRVVHSNLSPQSVLITVDGKVKLTDFGGQSQDGQDRTARHDMMKWKLAYMSPEQVGGDPVDSRSDIFSAGLLLYEMVTGEQAFQGATTEVFSLVRQAHYQAPETIVSGLPPKVYEIIHRCLKKDPTKRFPSAGALLEELQKIRTASPAQHSATTATACLQDMLSDDATDTRHKKTEPSQDNKPVAPLSTVTPKERKQNISQRTGSKPTEPTRSKPSRRKEKPSASIKKQVAKPAKKSPQSKTRRTLPAQEKEEVPTPTTRRKYTKKIPWLAAMPVALVVVLAVAWVFSRTPGKMKPESAESRTIKGAYQALEEGYYDQAVLGFEQALAADPTIRDDIAQPYAKALDGRASALLKDEPEKAEALLLTARKFDPESVEVYARLGLVYINRKEYSKAIETYERAVRIDPQLAEAFFNLGYVYAVKKDFSKAQEMYKEAVELSPPFLDEALFNLAVVQAQVGNRKQSIQNLQRAIETNPKNEQAKQYLRSLTS